MGRESVGEMTNINSFGATGGRECAVGFTHVRDTLGQENMEKYSNSSCHYAGECGGIA